MIKVYDFWCRMNREEERVALAEIERGRAYYNSMIAALNDRVQEQLPVIEALSGGDRFIARLCLLWPWFSPSPAQQEQLDNEAIDDDCRKTKQAIAIYALIAKTARDVRAEFPASSSGCYTGTYHAVQAAFDQAVGGKRKGTWPGERYRFRRQRDNRGAVCGVHLQGGTYTWGGLMAGKSSIFSVDELDPDARQQTSVSQEANHRWERRILRLKVAKESEPLTLRVKLHRHIPNDAVITHVTLARSGDYGSRVRWRLLVTAKTSEAIAVSEEPVGVAIGVFAMPDGSIHLATASNGLRLEIPGRAMRMRQKLPIVEAAREQAAIIERDTLVGDKSSLPSNPARVADYIERNNEASKHLEYLESEHYQHCLRDHLLKRSERIRKDAVRKFAGALRGKVVYIEKQDNRATLQNETTDATLKFSSLGLVSTAMKAIGATETARVSKTGEQTAPTLELAEAILAHGLRGNTEQKKAPSKLRKYRRRTIKPEGDRP